MDMNQQPDQVRDQPTKPLEWTWIAQRQESDGEANSIWKFGFIAPDGAQVRVTFHEVGDGNGQAPTDPTAQAMDMPATPGMAPSPPGAPPEAAPDQSQTPMAPPPPETPSGPGFAAAGQPNADQTQDATFYVTFFSNRHPEFFMKWDTSLSHEDSLATWVTITHGIVDFVRKAKPANVILDDLSNGKLKMIMRSIAMDVAAANPEYELQQTQKHHYRSFFEIKKKAIGSAFANDIAGRSVEGETDQPPTAQQGGMGQPGQQSQDMPNGVPTNGGEQNQGGDKTGNPTSPQPENGGEPMDNPAFAASSPMPIKQTPPVVKGLTLEIGKDYSVALKDNDGNALDRYRAKNPSDILRWINAKNYGNNRMVIVPQEQLSGKVASASASLEEPSTDMPPEKAEKKGENQVEQFEIAGKTIRINEALPAKQAAMMNLIINAENVRMTEAAVEFDFYSEKDMNFKRALVELAYRRTKS